MEFTVQEWEKERNKHAYVAESIDRAQYFKIWDDIASSYENSRTSTIRMDIFDKMAERGIIDRDMDVMDVGCGPGTYSELFAKKCRSVLCIDSSQKMLDVLAGKKLSNVKQIRSEWESFDTDEKFDLVFSSLCPAVRDPETLLKMEKFSDGYCADVSFVIDGKISLRNKVWMALGKEPHLSYWYDIRFPFELLKKMGRKPTLDIFKEGRPYVLEKEKVVSSELENLSYYMKIDDKIRTMVEGVVEEMSIDGLVHFEGKTELGLICWKVN